MATVEKRVRERSDGSTQLTYRVRYRDPAGHQRSKSFSRKVDADNYAAKVTVDQARGQWTDPRLGRTLYREWCEDWWSTTTNLRASTRVRYRGIIDNHLLPAFGDAQLASIRQIDVRRWVADLSADGLAPATVRKVYALFGKSMRAAVAAGLIARSPCHDVSLPKVEQDEMRFLTPAEIARIVDSMDDRWRVLVLVAAYAGLRVGELAGLRRRDVDLMRGTVTVAQVVVDVAGELHVGQPKTRAGRRTVGLPRAVVDELADHLIDVDESPDAYVFPAAEGGPLRVTNFRRRRWYPAVEAAGLDGVRLHDLRHTAVSLWIAGGANPKQVSAWAGHTSVSFTLDRYGHLFPNHDEELRDRLDAMYQAAERDLAERGHVARLEPDGR